MNEHAFYSLTAEQLMSREVLAVTERMSLQAAAHLMSDARVSGVPVVDDLGHCVGVLSTADFMSFVGKTQHAQAVASVPFVCSDWQVFAADELPNDEEVGSHMTRDVVTVAPTTPITELARLMLDAHIHRLLVVDAKRKLLGVVSSTDILAAVARSERRGSGGER
jgi:CBS domain-containing protein